MSYSYKYARPALTVDCVVFGISEGDLKVLLIRRALNPFLGSWALPGGYVQVEETLEAAARRELHEEAGIQDVYLEQLYTFGAIDRDPRERVITVAYYALTNLLEHEVRADTDASAASWFSLAELPKLAFDHRVILDAALKRLQGKLHYEPIGFELLPAQFTLTQLQKLYEAVWDRPLDKRNFRKKILKTGLLVPLDRREEGVAHRAAQYYRFDHRAYKRMQKEGFYFEI